MLNREWTNSFKKDIKRFKHDHNLIKELDIVIEKLQKGEELPAKNKDHPLTGNWSDHRECHVKNDSLLIYRTDTTSLILVRFGSHSELFK